MLTWLCQTLAKLFEPAEAKRRREIDNRYTFVRIVGCSDRHKRREDESCPDDKCLENIRAIDGDNREPEVQQ